MTISRSRAKILSLVIILLCAGVCLFSLIQTHGKKEAAGSSWSAGRQNQAGGMQGAQKDAPQGAPSGTFNPAQSSNQESSSSSNQGSSSSSSHQFSPSPNQDSNSNASPYPNSNTDQGSPSNPVPNQDQSSNSEKKVTNESGDRWNKESGKSDDPNHKGGPSGQRGGHMGMQESSSSSYGSSVATYAVLFAALAILAYVIIRKKGCRIPSLNIKTWLWTVISAGILLRIALAPWLPGHPFDLALFKNWATSAASSLSDFYIKGSSDYPPFYVYILYIVGKLVSLPGWSSYSTLLIKLPSILADGATALLLYHASRKYVTAETGFLIALFYMFNPAVFINSTVWGQVDSFFTLWIVAAFYFMVNQRLNVATLLLTAAVLMKPQGIIYVPVLFFMLLRQRTIKAWLRAAGTFALTTLVVILPFSFGQSPLWLIHLYSSTLGEYPYASVNAYNFFALIGANYTKDASTWFVFSYHTWGMIFIVLTTLFSWWFILRTRNPLYAPLAGLLQIVGVFTFSTSMHERYLFPAAALALLAYGYLRDKRLLWLAGGFSFTIFLNTYDIFYHSTNGGASYSVSLFLTSAMNVLLFIYLAWIVWTHAKKIHVPSSDSIETSNPKEVIIDII